MLHSENSAVGKYRIWQPAKYLERGGWSVQRIPDEPTPIPNDRNYSGDNPLLIENAKKYGSWEDLAEGSDIIVMQRPDRPESIALALALREQYDCPLVFEVDDNIYDVAESSTSYQYWHPGSPLLEIAELLMSQADALTVSTSELVKVYRHINPNIFVLPNFQDLDEWPPTPADTTSDESVVIGWQGSSTHYDDLYMIRRPLKKLLRNYPNVTFRCLGMKADFLVGHPQVEISTEWSAPYDWPKRLSTLGYDIGIAPVVDRPFNRSKSNIKWQEGCMTRTPMVVSSVGEYKKAVKHGETGFLASSEADWYFYLEQLIKYPRLRKQLGDAGYREVRDNYSMESKIGLWDKAYKDIIRSYNDRPKP